MFYCAFKIFKEIIVMNLSNEKIKGYGSYYSENGLWEKISNVAIKAGQKVIYAVLLLYYVLVSPEVPIKYKSIIIGALGYFILPVDLIPDFIPVAGYSDDLAALIAVLKTVSVCITPEIIAQAQAKMKLWFGTVDKNKIENLDI